MREELKPLADDWRDLEGAARVPRGTIKKFVESDEISDENLKKLDALNQQ